VETGTLLMTQKDRDRLVALKKAKKKLITQRQAAEELELTERHVRRLLVRLRQQGDAAVVHGLRGRPSNRKVDQESQARAMAMLKGDLYRGFGPTLASEYLAKKLGIKVSRETVRAWLIQAGLWRAKRDRVKAIHVWRERRPRRGELVQWDTSEHAWLEGRGIEAQGQTLYLISMVDDATSRLHGRFVLHDSASENMRLLWSYLELNGRPLSFYTDQAGLFKTAPKIPRDQKELPRDERQPLPPTQIGRALSELGVVWLGAHSPQAKGRVA
jgi:transposase